MNKNQALILGIAAGTLAGIAAGRSLTQPKRAPGLKIWQRTWTRDIGKAEAAGRAERVQGRYQALYDQRPPYDSRALRFHLENMILPGLALYQILLAEYDDRRSALIEVERLFCEQYGRYRPLMASVGRLPASFTLFRPATRGLMRIGFPPAGWEIEWQEDSDQSLAYDVKRCFYVDLLNDYGAPELTPLFCKMDDLVFAGLEPAIGWERSQTIGRQDEICDFRWNNRAAARGNGRGQPLPLTWRAMRFLNQEINSRVRPDEWRGDLILRLTTRGRRTGQPHITPLQYERVGDLLYVASARGQDADWFRNIQADPAVMIEFGGRHYQALAEPITDPLQIADFLELRLSRHPRMIRVMLLMHSLPPKADRAELEALANRLALVALRLHQGEPAPTRAT